MKYSIPFLFTLIIQTCFAQNPDTWIQKTSLPGPARVVAVAFSIDDKGYVGTGEDSTGNLLNDFWQYDPSTDSWTQVADFAGSARRNAVAFVINGFGYIGTGTNGGNNLNDFYKYDPSLNLWSQIDTLGKAYNASGRREAASFSIQQRGYVVGGYDGTSTNNNETWNYDEWRDTTWKKAKNFPASGRRWATGFNIFEFGFIGMGFNYSQEYFRDLWKYDTITDTWSQMANFPGTARANAASFSINGRAYVGAGFDGIYKNDFFIYNYADNTWYPMTAFAGGQTTGAVAFTINGKGYVCCGKDSSHYKNELWEYTPDSLVGINDFESDNSGLNIFPNPVNDILNISIPYSFKNISLILRDQNGRLIWRKELKARAKVLEEVSVKNLATGAYTLQMESSSRIISKTFIKQ